MRVAGLDQRAPVLHRTQGLDTRGESFWRLGGFLHRDQSQSLGRHALPRQPKGKCRTAVKRRGIENWAQPSVKIRRFVATRLHRDRSRGEQCRVVDRHILQGPVGPLGTPVVPRLQKRQAQGQGLIFLRRAGQRVDDGRDLVGDDRDLAVLRVGETIHVPPEQQPRVIELQTRIAQNADDTRRFLDRRVHISARNKPSRPQLRRFELETGIFDGKHRRIELIFASEPCRRPRPLDQLLRCQLRFLFQAVPACQSGGKTEPGLDHRSGTQHLDIVLAQGAGRVQLQPSHPEILGLQVPQRLFRQVPRPPTLEKMESPRSGDAQHDQQRGG